MPRELRRLARALGLRPATVGDRPGWRGLHVAVGVVGVGTRSAARGTARVLDELRPSRVLVMGVAGAVDEGLGIADVIAPGAVVDAATGTVYAPHDAGAGTGTGAGEHAPRSRTLVTVRRFGDPLPDGASAVDMETAAIAAECERRRTPWDVRRAISDLPGTVRPTVATLVGADGRVDVRAVVRLLVRDPRQLGDMRRLGRDTARAVGSLTTSAAAELRAQGLAGTP